MNHVTNILTRVSRGISWRGNADGHGCKARPRAAHAHSAVRRETRPSATQQTGPDPLPQQKAREKCKLEHRVPPGWRFCPGVHRPFPEIIQNELCLLPNYLQHCRLEDRMRQRADASYGKRSLLPVRASRSGEIMSQMLRQ